MSKYWAVLTPPRWRLIEAPVAPAARNGAIVIECARCTSRAAARQVIRDVRLWIQAYAAEPEKQIDHLRRIEAHLVNGYGTR